MIVYIIAQDAKLCLFLDSVILPLGRRITDKPLPFNQSRWCVGHVFWDFLNHCGALSRTKENIVLMLSWSRFVEGKMYSLYVMICTSNLK